jgi:dCMP deaminase
MKPKFIDYYMKIAEVTAGLSYAKRLQVGAVIVKDNQILATGYNGMPSGWENVCEYEEEVLMSEFGKGNWLEKTGQLKTKPEVLHAETNAIAKVAQSTESSQGSTLFCTHAPCIECAKLIYQSGISTVYYRDEYRSDAGLKFLRLSGVDVHQHSNSI